MPDDVGNAEAVRDEQSPDLVGLVLGAFAEVAGSVPIRHEPIWWNDTDSSHRLPRAADVSSGA